MKPGAAPAAVRNDLSGLAADLRRGTISPVDHLVERLDAVDRMEPSLQTFLPDEARRTRLLSEAGRLAERYPEAASRPPLFGIPVGVKDIFHVDGFPTGAGSRLPPEALAGPEAESVRRLRRAGALMLGKTVTTEFAYFAPGPTRNPRNPAHTPGGSSSGSAAAVAAGLAPLCLGSQTIGSVIRPAAFCGVVGVKPTYGRIPTDGVIPLAPSLDHVGFFTGEASDAALAASVLCDRWSDLPEPELPVLGVPSGPYLERAGPAALERFEAALDSLASAGVPVHRLEALEDFDAIAARHQTILAAEAARVHADWHARFGDRYHERTSALIADGQQVSENAYRAALDGQAATRRRLHTLMEDAGIDLWAAPASVGPAPHGLESTGDPVMNLPWTHAGLPALTLPLRADGDGLPLGLQLVGGWYQDERLLAWSARLEGILAQAGLSLSSPPARGTP